LTLNIGVVIAKTLALVSFTTGDQNAEPLAIYIM
jgi:hypothetical protein